VGIAPRSDPGRTVEPPDEQGRLLSFEGRVLIEADILDKLGACAVTSALLNLGGKGKLPHECRAAMAQGVAMERAALFKDYVWTETGTRLAAERYLVFVGFLKQLAEEVDDGEDPCGSA
jgi:citrate lyase gamma subunit